MADTPPEHASPSPSVDRRPGAGWPALTQLIRLPNQSGTLLLMLPTLWSLVLASEGRPSPALLAVFIAGSFLMRSAGVVLNDLADRSFDRQVERTKTRPLASGALDVPAAYAAVVVLLAFAAGLLLFVNRLTVWLSPVAVLLAALYPFSKRVVQVPQAVLGIAFGWGAVMAWTAVRNTLDAPVWFLYAATVCWAVGYDTIYALQDREDDARIGVKSSAVLFGPRTWLAVALALGGMLVMLGVAGWLVDIGPIFYVTLVMVGWFMSRQIRRLLHHVTPFLAVALFKEHVWLGAVILAGIWVGILTR